ncbi:MAG: coenzyme F420-0:L-glutamate ligase [Acidimicrobiales bacterium]
MTLTIAPVHGIGEIVPGADLAGAIAEACAADPATALPTATVSSPRRWSPKARTAGAGRSRRPAVAQAARRGRGRACKLRRRGDLLITETAHGFVCANAGIDLSNVDRYAALLPVDADRSARRIRDGLRARCGATVGVIVSDTFGRTWRRGVTDVAIGIAGIAGVIDLRGTADAYGRELQVTEVCVADELASAAELVMGKATGVPVAVVRGVDPDWLRPGSVADEIVRAPADDLFR